MTTIIDVPMANRGERLPSYSQTRRCGSEEFVDAKAPLWCNRGFGGESGWYELERALEMLDKIHLRSVITAQLPSKQSRPLFSVGKRQREGQQEEHRRYLLSHNKLDQDSDQYHLELLNWIPPAYVDDDEPPPPYREFEEESLATSRAHLPLKKMGVEPPPSFFSGKFFGITDRAGKKKRTGTANKSGISGGTGNPKKAGGKAPAGDGGSGDANPNGGGADGSGGGDDSGDKKKDEEARNLKEKEEEEEKKRKEEEEEEAKRKELDEEKRKADEAAQGTDGWGADDDNEAAFESVPTKRSKERKKKEPPPEGAGVKEAIPGDDGMPGGWGDSADRSPPSRPDPPVGVLDPEPGRELGPAEKKKKEREEREERRRKAREGKEPKMKSTSKRDAVPETQPEEAPAPAPPPHLGGPIEKNKRRVAEELKDDVDSEKEADVASPQPEAAKVPTFPSIGVGSGWSKLWSPWAGANPSAPNLDKGPGSQTASKSSAAQETSAQAPPTALKEAKTGRAQREKPSTQGPPSKIEEAVEVVPIPGPRKLPGPVPERGIEIVPAPAHESTRGGTEPMPLVKQSRSDKEKEKVETREAAKLGRGKRVVEESKRVKELELEQQGEKRARGVKGAKVAAAAAAFEAKTAATSPLGKKTKGVVEKLGQGLETEVELKAEREPAVEPMSEVTVKEVAAEPEPGATGQVAQEEEPNKGDVLPGPTAPEEDTYDPGYGRPSHIQYANTSGINYVPTLDKAPYAPVPEGPKYAQLKQYEYAQSTWGFTKPKKTTRGAPTPAPVPPPAPAGPAETDLVPEVIEEAPPSELLKSPIGDDADVGIIGAAAEVVGVELETAPPPPSEEEPSPASAPAPREKEREREKKSKKDGSVWGTILGAPKTAKKKAPDVEVSINSNPCVIESESEVDCDAEIENGEQRVRRSSTEVDANGSPIKVVGLRDLWKMNKEVGKRQKSARNTPLVEKTQEEAILEVTPEATQVSPPALGLAVEIPQFEEPEIAPETPAPKMLPIESYLVPPTPLLPTPQFDIGEPSPRGREFPPHALAPAPRSSKKERKKKKEPKYEEEPIEEAPAPPEPTIVEPEAEPTVGPEVEPAVDPEAEGRVAPEPEHPNLSGKGRKKKEKKKKERKEKEVVEEPPALEVPEVVEEALPEPEASPTSGPGLIMGMLTGWGTGSGSAASGVSANAEPGSEPAPKIGPDSNADHEHWFQKDPESEPEQEREPDPAPEPEAPMGRRSREHSFGAAPAPAHYAGYPGYSSYPGYPGYQGYPAHHFDHDPPAPRALIPEELPEEKPHRHRSRKYRELQEEVHATNSKEVKEKHRRRKVSIQEPEGVAVAMERKKTHSSENVDGDKGARRERRRLKKQAVEQAEMDRLRREAEEKAQAEHRARAEAEERARIEAEERRRAERRAKKAKKAEKEARLRIAEQEALLREAGLRAREEAIAASQQKLERRKSSRRNSGIPAEASETREEKEARREARRIKKAAKEGRVSMSRSNSDQTQQRAHGRVSMSGSNSDQVQHAQDLARAMNGIGRRYSGPYVPESERSHPYDDEYEHERRRRIRRERREAHKAQEANLWQNREDISGSITPEQIPESEDANNHRFSSSYSNDMMEEEQALRERRRQRKEALKVLERDVMMEKGPIMVDDEERRTKKHAKKEKRSKETEDPEVKAARRAARARKRLERERFNGGLTDYEGNIPGGGGSKKSWWKKLLS
ncbi:unnamed protein product [Tuber aestivum]|uniref:Uncharacterized protein n=1 Tax=Tuber aestivum TaxID=59557 RepID=A0A292PT07_9PEZI|nr:unnamed protein product [Tuber aestivum]